VYRSSAVVRRSRLKRRLRSLQSLQSTDDCTRKGGDAGGRDRRSDRASGNPSRQLCDKRLLESSSVGDPVKKPGWVGGSWYCIAQTSWSFTFFSRWGPNSQELA
jgi:hypothetical protein